ncbi:AAA family ATPase [Pseudoalteromonas sp. B193]
MNHHLLDLQEDNERVVLLIDEAQCLSWETLEALRLFTNLETESEKLIQVVLFGQPELDEKLANNKVRQLRQRISFSYKLRSDDWC